MGASILRELVVRSYSTERSMMIGRMLWFGVLAVACGSPEKSEVPPVSGDDTSDSPSDDTGGGAPGDDTGTSPPDDTSDADDTGTSPPDDTSDADDTGSEPLPVDEDGDGVSVEDGDCDDGRADVYPGASEVCDEVDNNCDDVVDEGVTSTFYADTDADGYGDALTPVEACEAPASHVEDNTDCDDTAATVSPGSTEICDEQDNDCDGEIDEEVETIWFLDFDADGAGTDAFTWESCEAPIGYVSTGDDCDDTSSSAYPGALEVCDEEDNNCDGVIDEGLTSVYYRDADGDGHGDAESAAESCWAPTGYIDTWDDCDDSASHSYPGATEICDAEDNDCDGEIDEDPGDGAPVWYRDGDGDGYAGTSVSIRACSMPDGWMAEARDCDDSSSATHPGAEEICDEEDNDCNGIVDDDASDVRPWYADGDGDGFGDADSALFSCDVPGLGYITDATDCDDSNPDAFPGGVEICDEADNDCNGIVDDDPVDGFVFYVDDDGDGHGDPESTPGIACSLSIGTSDVADDCDDTDPYRSPSEAEIECNGVDDDCDGEDFCPSSCGDGVLDEGEEMDPAPGPYSSIIIDSETCRWDFAGINQLYCNGSCTWAGGSSCDGSDADILCKLLTDNPASTAISWTATVALSEPGFSCPGHGGTIEVSGRGVDVDVWYQDSPILATHGPGDVVAYPVCTDP